MRIRLFILFSVLALTLSAMAVFSKVDTIVESQSEHAVQPSAASAFVSPTPKVSKDVGVIFISEWDGEKIERTDAEWKGRLTEFEYYILREKGTEEAYTGKLTDNKTAGTYHCAACGLALFSSKHKYDSETGWPSFYQPIKKEHVQELEDKSIPEEPRTEIVCARCGSHQGHVFDDGPEPTGLRYCINSAALKFSKNKTAK